MTMRRKRWGGRALVGAGAVLLLVLLGGLAAWARPAADTSVAAEEAAVPAAAGSQSLGFSSARQMVKTGPDSLALVWTDGGGTEVVVGERRFGSSSFSSRTTVATGARVAAPAIAGSGATLAVAWIEGRTVYARVRLNGAWLPEQRVGEGGAPALAAAKGYLGLVWHSAGGDAISFSRRSLTARAGAWSPPVTLVEGGGDTVSFASLAATGSRFVAVWKRGDRGRWAVELRRSNDQGKRWTAARAVADGADPAVCLRSPKELWIGHQTTGGRVVVEHSTDGGRTFTRRELGDGWFAHVSCTAGGVAVAWEQTPYPPKHPDESVKSFGLAFVSPDGAVRTLPSPADGYVASPTVLADGNRGAVAWIDTSGGPGGLAGSLEIGDVDLG